MSSFISKVPGFRSGKLWKKIVASIFYFYFIIFLIVIIAAPNTKKESKPIESPPISTVVVEEKKEPPFDIENTVLDNENVKKAVSVILPSKEFPNIFVDKDTIEVYYNPEYFYDDTDLVKKSANNAVKAYEYLFKNKGINTIFFYTITSMTDIKGNSNDETVLTLKLTKTNASDINWPKFVDMVQLDYKALIRVIDDYYIHPGVAKNLN